MQLCQTLKLNQVSKFIFEIYLCKDQKINVQILITNISVYRSMDQYVFTNIEDMGVGKVFDHVIDRDGKML